MSIPKRNDGSVDWRRVKHQDPKHWHEPEEAILAQSFDYSEDDIESPRLMESLSEVGSMFASSGARQMKMMFDDILHKHHPEGFDDYDDEY